MKTATYNKTLMPTITIMAVLTLCVMMTPTASLAEGYTVSGEITFTKTGPIYLELLIEEEFQVDGHGDHGQRGNDQEPPEEPTASDPNRRLVLEVDAQSAKAKKVAYTFTNIPEGVYAIQAYQDVNENGHFDMGMLGPKEPYGFSNSVRPRFSHPKLEDAKFAVQGDVRDVSFGIR